MQSKRIVIIAKMHIDTQVTLASFPVQNRKKMKRNSHAHIMNITKIGTLFLLFLL